MLVESMAGKSGSMNGVFQDATPFQFHEERKVIDYLGEQLRYVPLTSLV
jgi:DNA-directed RNA polymerase I subunit RPA2